MCGDYERSDGLRLLNESRPALWIGDEPRWKYFERDFTAKRDIECAVDDTHTRLAPTR